MPRGCRRVPCPAQRRVQLPLMLATAEILLEAAEQNQVDVVDAIGLAVCRPPIGATARR
jgi:hypothetical protein